MLALGASITLRVSVASSMPEYTSSADKVAANNDLLTEILIQLPARSLMRFKSVSKHWLSLTIYQYFVLCQNPDSSSVSGLLLQASWTSIVPEPDFISSIQVSHVLSRFFRYTNFKFVPWICCLGHCGNDPNPSYLVLIPTTKQFKLLPELLYTGSEGLSLALDPSRSPHYKVVRVPTTWTHVSPLQSVCYYRIEIYSTETGSWRASGEPFTIENDSKNTQFHAGVYWNGANY